MYGKIVIECKLKVQTGMHIGGSSSFSAIGAVDSPVIRDAFTGQPMLPGSSLKGKMRSLLAKSIKNHYITQDCSNDPVELKGYLVPLGTDKQTKTQRVHGSSSLILFYLTQTS